MKNITLSVDERVLETVRRYASMNNTSVNAIVRTHLERLAEHEKQGATARRRLVELSDQSSAKIGESGWNRDKIYER